MVTKWQRFWLTSLEMKVVAILSGTLSASNHIERVNGFKDYITENTNIEIVDEQPDNDSVEDALSITEGYLSTYPDLKGVFGCNGAAPVGACRANQRCWKSWRCTCCRYV
ncbi:MAG: sugar ABC transporter substrate-binding protein [Blautia faecis]